MAAARIGELAALETDLDVSGPAEVAARVAGDVPQRRPDSLLGMRYLGRDPRRPTVLHTVTLVIHGGWGSRTSQPGWTMTPGGASPETHRSPVVAAHYSRPLAR